MRPDIRVWSEESPELLEVTQEWHGLVVIRETRKSMQASLTITQKPVLLKHLARACVSVGYPYASVGRPCAVNTLVELKLRPGRSRGPEARRYTNLWSTQEA